MNYVKKIANEVCSNIIIQGIFVIILLLPLIGTLGQYISSGFILEKTGFSILFWPGIKNDFRIVTPVWISMGLMLISYVVGIIYMCKRKTFGKVIIIGMLAITIAQLMGSMFNHFTGWHEMQNVNNMARSGIVNRLIFAEWHDPVWEETVFTGIPLIILMLIKNKASKKVYKIGITIYLLVPTIAMAIYHIPNHGLSRIIDTSILHLALAWLALKYSFFASLVLHYIFDTMIVISLGNMKGIPYKEVAWLTNNSSFFNTIFSISILCILVLVPVLTIWYIRKDKKSLIISH